MIINNLKELIENAKKNVPKKLVIVCAEDKTTLSAVFYAWQKGLIIPVFSGNKALIIELCKEINFDVKEFEFLDANSDEKAVKLAVKYIKDKKGQLLMKGLVSTATLLKGILHPSDGIRNQILLSHFALFESPYYHKVFGVTDAAMNISPSLQDKQIIIQNAVELYHKLNNPFPKVALVCPIEKVNPKIQSTIDAATLVKMNKKGQIQGCVIDGPFALDNAISREAAIHKGIKSEVAGDADILVPHGLDAANILYKAINFLGNGKCAAIVLGAIVPVVLTSRADDEETKLLSIALGCLLA
ncbi:MAG: bifunctional enoyl-CoA hydratase/phosphate acetyltransferase [Bacteroidales bacterium]|nr:bifunctional enoyl-CoA hydratase/phosphate acetyltransferase [Bacteroidales bacterium]